MNSGRESEPGPSGEDEGPLTLRRPAGEGAPLLVEVPHAGLLVPKELEGVLAAPMKARLRDADIYVDRLFADAPRGGATLLAARYSRYVVDLNRGEDDVDRATVSDHPAPRPAQPRGVVWRLATDGRALSKGPLSHAEFERRLEVCYRPYHRALREELTRLRAAYGHAILLAAHSMPSTGIGLRGERIRRADVVPGTRGFTTADMRVVELVESHFKGAGLSVRHDEPYRGGFSTGHYGRPREGIHAVQIELNRALYVDEQSFEPKEPEFRALVVILDGLVQKLGELRLD